jgi:aryl-alcohol dehydrogenase-like predicted oxidoreductase
LEKESNSQTDILQAALKCGVNFIDTADIYGQGHNEELVGEAIKRFGRDKFFLATKHAIIRKGQTTLGFDGA